MGAVRNPFKLVLATAYGSVNMGVGPGHVAELTSPVNPATLKIVPLEIDGVQVAIEGKAVRRLDGWDFTSLKSWAIGEGALPLGRWEALMDAIDDALSEHESRFVEADIVGIHSHRKDRDAKIAAIEDEIARRVAKLNQMKEARAAEEEYLVPRESGLRSLLSDLREIQGVGVGPTR